METPCVPILKKQKCNFFCKIAKQEGRIGPTWEIETNERVEEVGKGFKMVNIVQILYTHKCKQKKDTSSNYFSNGGRWE
jgi:hypothetical protein